MHLEDVFLKKDKRRDWFVGESVGGLREGYQIGKNGNLLTDLWKEATGWLKTQGGAQQDPKGSLPRGFAQQQPQQPRRRSVWVIDCDLSCVFRFPAPL